MNSVLERITDPEIEAVTLAELRQHLRLFSDITNEDAYLSELIVLAREWVTEYTGRALIDETWTQTVQEYVSGSITLLRSPALAVVTFVSVGDDGAETAIDSYELREAGGRWPRLVPPTGSTWGAGTLRLTYRAGFANREVSPQDGAEKVPRAIKHAIRLLAAHEYENRQPLVIGTIASELPLGIKALLETQRSNMRIA